ncbi:MAG: c-type cytochrome [Kiloniellales bacterium]
MRRIVLGMATVALLWAVQAKAGDPEEGGRLARQWCAECHLVGPGDNQAVAAAPTFQALANDVRKTPDYLRAFLVRPHEPMPPLSLSRREIDDLIAYIISQK